MLVLLLQNAPTDNPSARSALSEPLSVTPAIRERGAGPRIAPVPRAPRRRRRWRGCLLAGDSSKVPGSQDGCRPERRCDDARSLRAGDIGQASLPSPECVEKRNFRCLPLGALGPRALGTRACATSALPSSCCLRPLSRCGRQRKWRTACASAPRTRRDRTRERATGTPGTAGARLMAGRYVRTHCKLDCS